METPSNKTLSTFINGAKSGLPICLGYISVSFAFGMMAVQNGLPVWVAVLISMSNFTSAGQFAGTNLILSGGMYIEIAITTFVINIRYMLMSLSLSQKVSEKMKTLERLILSFGNTDEVFAVAMQQKGAVTTPFLAGLITTPYLGWTLGTLLGAIAMGMLPLSLRVALGIAIYGMFIAIIIPPCKKAKPVLITVILAIILSCILNWTPIFKELSNGWIIIICAILTSAFVAYRYPISEEEEGESE